MLAHSRKERCAKPPTLHSFNLLLQPIFQPWHSQRENNHSPSVQQFFEIGRMLWNITSLFAFLTPLFSSFAQTQVLRLLQKIEYGRLNIVIASKDGSQKPSSLCIGKKKSPSEHEVTLTINHVNFWTRVFWNLDVVSIFFPLLTLSKECTLIGSSADDLSTRDLPKHSCSVRSNAQIS